MSDLNVLKFVREEDFVEYFLFPQLTTHSKSTEKIKSDLENTLKEVNNAIEQHISRYIWHKDEFNLTIRTPEQQLLLEEDDERKESLPPHLYGVTHYGENILDEWFIVFLLYEITKKIPGIVGRVIDSDGEFLLIEAANVLPKWADGNTCEQRVYIFDGHLQLVQNSPSNTLTILNVSSAISKIWQNPTLYRVSEEIQSCINERIEEFSGNMDNMFHYQIVRVPLAIAAILKEKPALIAPAVRIFCDRDAIEMQACRAMRYFPPENRVRTRIKFTRCLYAMIMSDKYVPDRRIGWGLPPVGTEKYKEDILGVKIACGFEILAFRARQNDNVENDCSWKVYLNCLVQKGYFKDYLEGSKDYCRLLEEAKNFYKENRDRFRTVPFVGKEILTLLTDLEINGDQLRNEENNLIPSDPDEWFYMTPEEIDKMLITRYGINKLYKVNGHVNAAKFTLNIREFLEKESEFDGIEETPGSSLSVVKRKKNVQSTDNHKTKDTNPNEINFDPDSFQTHVKNFLDFVIPEDDWESTSEMSDYEDDDDLEKNIEDMANTKMSFETNIRTYMDQMDRELSKTTIGKSFEMKSSSKTNNDSDDFDDIESFKPIDIDVNTLKNMAESYKSQLGRPGPVTNLFSVMGIGIQQSSENNKESEDTATDMKYEDYSGTHV